MGDLTGLTQGTLAEWIYGVNTGGNPRKYNTLGIKNVKDYGAVGDGSTDDTAAIQAAIDDTSSPWFSTGNRGIIYFPPSSDPNFDYYLVSGSLNVISDIRNIVFYGPGARIQGSVNGPIINRPIDSNFGGIYVIDGLEVYNIHATGKGITWQSIVGGAILNCSINAWRGIECWGSQSIVICGCDIIRGNGTKSTSHGIVAGNGTSVISTDVTSFGKGIVHQNLGLVIHGGRMEVNDTAIILGEDENGNLFQSSSVSIRGLSMEANPIGLHVRSAVAGTISFNQGAGVQCTTGMLVENCTDMAFDGISISSSIGFTDAVFALEGPIARCSFNAMNGASWRVDANALQSATFQNTTMPALNAGNLPTAPIPGAIYEVDDATTPAIGSAYTGGAGSAAIVQVQTDGSYLVVGL